MQVTLGMSRALIESPATKQKELDHDGDATSSTAAAGFTFRCIIGANRRLVQ
jgi:hypothetical protein